MTDTANSPTFNCDTECTKPVLRPSPAELQRIVAQYDPEDVYCVDEITINWFKLACPEKATPQKSFHKITALLCCNGDASDKHWPVIIGDERKWVRNKADRDRGRPPFEWYRSCRGGPDPQVFQTWVQNFEETVNRKILLIADDIKAHMFLDPKIENVQLVYIEASIMKGLGTPFDGDVRKEFDQQYQVRYRAAGYQDKRRERDGCYEHFDGMDAANLCSRVWRELSPTLLRNAWMVTLARWQEVSYPAAARDAWDNTLMCYATRAAWLESDIKKKVMVFSLSELLDNAPESTPQRRVTNIESLISKAMHCLKSEDHQEFSEGKRQQAAMEGLDKFLDWGRIILKARNICDPLDTDLNNMARELRNKVLPW